MWVEAQTCGWRGKLQFDIRKRECSGHDLCVIGSLREQFIHHSAHCWQLAFPGELIWWQQPALSCHFYQGWEAYSCRTELIALAWHHACTQIGACQLWGRDGSWEHVRAINWPLKNSWSAPRMTLEKWSVCFDDCSHLSAIACMDSSVAGVLASEQMKLWTLLTGLWCKKTD